jgi:hypothetical protein
MWYRAFQLKHKVRAILLLEGAGGAENNEGRISLRAMYNEYFLEEFFEFNNRDDAYSFIKNCQIEFVQDVVDRLVADTCSGYDAASA